MYIIVQGIWSILFILIDIIDMMYIDHIEYHKNFILYITDSTEEN